MAARPHWYKIFKGQGENNNQLRIVYLAKLSFKNMGEMKVFFLGGWVDGE